MILFLRNVEVLFFVKYLAQGKIFFHAAAVIVSCDYKIFS